MGVASHRSGLASRAASSRARRGGRGGRGLRGEPRRLGGGDAGRQGSGKTSGVGRECERDHRRAASLRRRRSNRASRRQRAEFEGAFAEPLASRRQVGGRRVSPRAAAEGASGPRAAKRVGGRQIDRIFMGCSRADAALGVGARQVAR
eukprot:1911751-Pyramimonas_sp.AAC.1